MEISLWLLQIGKKVGAEGSSPPLTFQYHLVTTTAKQQSAVAQFQTVNEAI